MNIKIKISNVIKLYIIKNILFLNLFFLILYGIDFVVMVIFCFLFVILFNVNVISIGINIIIEIVVFIGMLNCLIICLYMLVVSIL